MLLVIDPDVFVASVRYFECEQVLDWIANHLDEYEFALDHDNVLDEMYLEFFVEHMDKEMMAILILKHLDLYSADPQTGTAKITRLSSNCTDDIESLLKLRGLRKRTSQIERLLICMAIDAPKRGLTVVLTHPQDEYQVVVILSEAKNLGFTGFTNQIPRFARNDNYLKFNLTPQYLREPKFVRLSPS